MSELTKTNENIFKTHYMDNNGQRKDRRKKRIGKKKKTNAFAHFKKKENRA